MITVWIRDLGIRWASSQWMESSVIFFVKNQNLHDIVNTTIVMNVSLHAADLTDANVLDAKLSQVKTVTRG
jgi:hypothetical protein